MLNFISMFTKNNMQTVNSTDIADFMGSKVFKMSNLKKCLQKTTRKKLCCLPVRGFSLRFDRKKLKVFEGYSLWQFKNAPFSSRLRLNGAYIMYS